MKKTILLSIFTASVLSASNFGVEVGASQSNLKADFQYGSNATATKVDENILGLDDKITTIKPRVYFNSGNHTFDFDYESLDFSGANTLTQDIEFDDETYTATTNIKSTMEIDWYRLGYRYSVINNGNTYLNAGLDLNILDTNIGLEETAGNTSSYFDEVIPLPTLVLDGNYAFNEKVGVEAKFAGISVGSEGSYTEAYAGLNIQCLLLDNAKWRLGYKAKKLDVDVDDFDGELEFKGAFLGFNYKF
ncbi:MAG: hypothetical protein ACQERD_08750 [Campylobacterota bacterium]